MPKIAPTECLARFVAEIRFQDLPDQVVHQACRVILDGIGCAIAAWREDAEKARIATRLVAGFSAKGCASVIGGGRSDAALAALANGILINAADFDDTHKRALIHVASTVVPPALAIAETQNLSGQQIITAVVAGYEVAARVGMAVMPSHYRFWHSTATNGTFGAAAAASSALGLSMEQVRTALGFAGTQAAGLNTFFESGDDTKSLHPGKASFNGVLAARLAVLGASSPPNILEHPKGYLAAYSTDPKPEQLSDGLGERWEILANGFKYYPSILASHSPIGATLKLVNSQEIKPAKIRSITNNTYNTVKSHFSNKDVSSTMAARLSVPYCIAAAAVDGEITQAQFQLERVLDPMVQQVLERTQVIADAELNTLYPEKFPARVVIEMENGETHEASVHYPKGDPQNPLTSIELEEKFRGNAAALLSCEETEVMISAIMGLADMADTASLLRPLGREYSREEIL